MRRTNIASPAFASDPADPEGFRVGLFRPGPDLGAEITGLSLYDVPPGQAVCPYHYEYGEEEWLLVVEGRPTLRDPDGDHVLEPWDVVFFPRGPEGAHGVRNDTDATVRVVMFSNRVFPTGTAYPDSGKVALWTANRDEDVIVRRSSAVDYYDGETAT